MKVRIPNSGGPSNMNAMIKQAQKMQEDMATLQADLEQREYEGTAGGSSVSVIVDGKHKIKKLTIDPSIIDPDDTEMIEDLVTVAVNAAIDQASKTAEEEMGAITGGLNFPGMF
ncbi:MAG: YbaB/EbfC family nucleoid-associated protein [Ruminococcaceae bacterium]|nr:YbaB/EbfC family nucleoid-associated protein [Oscillospiraceae bacterium]